MTRNELWDRNMHPNVGPWPSQPLVCMTLFCAYPFILCPVHCLSAWGCADLVGMITALVPKPLHRVPCCPTYFCSPRSVNPLWCCGEPIGWAASHGQLHTVMALVANGADPRAKNGASRNAFDDAGENKHTHVVEWLKAWEAAGTVVVSKIPLHPTAAPAPIPVNTAVLWCSDPSLSRAGSPVLSPPPRARGRSLARTLSTQRVAVVALVQHVVGRLVRGRGREAASTENLGHPRHLGAGQDRGGDAGNRGCEAARRGHRGRRWRDRAHVQRVREAPDEAAARDARANLREAATARRLGGVGELGSGSSVLAVPLCQQHGEPAAPTTVPTTVPLTAPLTAPPCPPPWAACTWRRSLCSDVRQPHEGLPTGAGHSAETSGASQGAESGGQCGGAAGGSDSFNWKKSIKTQLK
eukprot:scaffold32732_cov69-Phaeocystis_antarctica.AAC.1